MNDHEYEASKEVLLAEALGRYSAYGYCMRQLDSLMEASVDAVGTEWLQMLKTRIGMRYHEAADDWQALAVDTEEMLNAKEDYRYE